MGIYVPKKTPEEHAAYMREYRAKNKDGGQTTRILLNLKNYYE